MTGFQIVPADRLEPAALHGAMAAAFSDYLLGPFLTPLGQWSQFLSRQSIDLAASRVALDGSDIAAFQFVARRTDIPYWRLSTMGSPPHRRGSGGARELLDDFIHRAREAGMTGVELECFAQNERALRLYRSRGFEAMSELRGYARDPQARVAMPHSDVATVTLDEAFALIDRVARSRGDLPVQVTPVSLRAGLAPLHALRSGEAVLAYSESVPGTIGVQAIVDPDPSLRNAEALAAHVSALFPAHRIAAGQVQRPDIGGDALERQGFERLPLHQLLMRRQF